MRTSLLAFILAASLVPWIACDPEAMNDSAAPLDIEVDEDDADGPAGCDDPARAYVSHEPELCRQVLFVCEGDMNLFNDACGCGCEVAETPAPLPEEKPLAAP